MLTAREEREASHNSREQPELKQAVLKNSTYRTDVATMRVAALKFQLCLRGVGVDDPDNTRRFKKKGKGRRLTAKQHCLNIANGYEGGKWQELKRSYYIEKENAII